MLQPALVSEDLTEAEIAGRVAADVRAEGVVDAIVVAMAVAAVVVAAATVAMAAEAEVAVTK